MSLVRLTPGFFFEAVQNVNEAVIAELNQQRIPLSGFANRLADAIKTLADTKYQTHDTLLQGQTTTFEFKRNEEIGDHWWVTVSFEVPYAHAGVPAMTNTQTRFLQLLSVEWENADTMVFIRRYGPVRDDVYLWQSPNDHTD